jgi:DNA-binding NtrC family response regulator
MFREHATVRRVRSLPELQRVLERHESYDAVFCGWSFQAGTWNDAVGQVHNQCPDLPVIIFSGNGGEQEWVQVLEAGAFDLLVAPYQRRTVLPVLEQAVASCEARRTHQSRAYARAMAG